ncbi:MAG: hypothetical protein ACI9Z3_001060 [Roseivirga sp.]|jgi:hypothetical protein
MKKIELKLIVLLTADTKEECIANGGLFQILNITMLQFPLEQFIFASSQLFE